MFAGNDTVMAIVAFFLVLGPLIFFHELGHFLAAKAWGVAVEEFGIGFPPRLFSFEYGGTTFSFNLIPLGGFVKPKGEDDPSQEGGLAAASKRARFSVLAAGPGANFILAYFILVVMFMMGAPEPQPGAEIVGVGEGSPAQVAGLQPGDIVTQADGAPVESYEELTTAIYGSLGEALDLTILRGETISEITVIPRSSWPDGEGPTGIVIQQPMGVVNYGFVSAWGRAGREMVDMIRMLFLIPSLVIEQQIPLRYLRPVSVVGISQIGGQVIDQSVQQNAGWPILQLAANISIALAITNLLPIPALDGGRILFVLIEALRGKRMNPDREMVIHFVGFAVLMLTMVVFVYLDIVDPLVQ